MTARITCEACGTEVLEQSAVKVTRGDAVHRFCSARCADAAEAAAALRPALIPKRIVAAFDGSGASLRALELAAGFAKASGGTITLVYAIDMTGVAALTRLESGPDFIGRLAIEVEQALRQDAESQLSPARRFLDDAGISYTEQIDVGSALTSITRAGADADLVVIGSRGMGAISGAILGSLSQRVIGAVGCPVLIVH